jgi:hypothetical protein
MCIPDYRVPARAIGCVAIVILCLVFGTILFFDLDKFVRFVTGIKQNDNSNTTNGSRWYSVIWNTHASVLCWNAFNYYVYKVIVKVLEKYYCFNLTAKSVNKYHGVRHTLSVTLDWYAKINISLLLLLLMIMPEQFHCQTIDLVKGHHGRDGIYIYNRDRHILTADKKDNLVYLHFSRKMSVTSWSQFYCGGDRSIQGAPTYCCIVYT